MSARPIRNIAIIAHVDHGKTTLVDHTFLFQIVGVHDALNQLLVSGKGAGLAQQLVN